MSGPLSVISTGTRTPLGLHSAATAAAVRARISSCAEHPYMIDQAGDPMPASIDAVLNADLPCRQRMLAMAQTALAEACQPLTGSSAIQSLPLLLGLPEPRPGFDKEDAHWISQQLAWGKTLPVPISDHRAYMGGHGSVLFLLDQARREIAAGQYDACVIGGVESYFHPDTMEWLDRNRQLLNTASRAGFVPAEGAGFCLLMTPAAAQRAGLNPIALILNTAHEWEPNRIKTQDINLGQTLTAVVRTVVDTAPLSDVRIHGIYCDINGERYRGEEWGFACLKLAHYFDDPTDYRSPAECWGDMGAASGGLFLTLATQAAMRGYAGGRHSLLWTGSENGLRATALLEADLSANPFRG